MLLSTQTEPEGRRPLRPVPRQVRRHCFYLTGDKTKHPHPWVRTGSKAELLGVVETFTIYSGLGNLGEI